MVVLPNEILCEILKHVSGNDLRRCRNVCQQWRDAADTVSELSWAEISEEIQKKSNLSWSDLHKSLKLWSKVKYAEIKSKGTGTLHVGPESFRHIFERHTISDNIQHFKLVNGTNTVSYPRCNGADYDAYNPVCYNTIDYYDLETLHVTHSKAYEFEFEFYDENETFIVLVSKTLSTAFLRVITKSNEGINDIGDLKIAWSGVSMYDEARIFLFKTCIYFKNTEDFLCICKLANGNGIVSIETEILCHFNKLIIAISYVKRDHINILTRAGNIYSLIDKNIVQKDHIGKSLHLNEVVKILKTYSFDWSCPYIYKWLNHKGYMKGDIVGISKLKNATVFNYGKVIVVATLRRFLHIYYDPFRNDGELKLYNARPTRTINLNKLYPVDNNSPYKNMEQIDIVEMKNGHKIVLLYCKRIIVIDLLHNSQFKRTAEKTSGESICIGKKIKT